MRLFIALPVPEQIQERIVLESAELRGRYPDLKWVRQDALHLTLIFLGELEESRLEAITRAMEEAASEVAPFDLELRGLGAFPQRGAPRVLFIPLARGVERARGLHRKLKGALGGIGTKDRKRFAPHLTLARVKGKPEFPDPEKEGNELRFSFAADRIHLYRSHLDSRGARYELLREAKLAYDMEQE